MGPSEPTSKVVRESGLGGADVFEASELLRGEAPFVAGTSAWWRVAALPSELGDLLDAAILSDRMWPPLGRWPSAATDTTACRSPTR
jgi:hypothetical protein